MPDILTYLTDQGIPTDDLYATFHDLQLDPLDRIELALIIGDEAGIEVPDETYEAWDTLADVLETAGKLQRAVA